MSLLGFKSYRQLQNLVFNQTIVFSYFSMRTYVEVHIETTPMSAYNRGGFRILERGVHMHNGVGVRLLVLSHQVFLNIP